jgi:hypothetical protein
LVRAVVGINDDCCGSHNDIDSRRCCSIQIRKEDMRNQNDPSRKSVRYGRRLVSHQHWSRSIHPPLNIDHKLCETFPIEQLSLCNWQGDPDEILPIIPRYTPRGTSSLKCYAPSEFIKVALYCRCLVERCSQRMVSFGSANRTVPCILSVAVEQCRKTVPVLLGPQRNSKKPWARCKTWSTDTFWDKTRCRVHSHWPHIVNSHWYPCSIVHWAAEPVVNRWSRYPILHKTWFFLSQCYSKLLEWSILDNSDDRYAPQLSETTACRRYRVEMMGAEWQNVKQRPLHSLYSHVEYCNQEKDCVLYRGLFRREIPVVQLLMKVIECLINNFAFCD